MLRVLRCRLRKLAGLLAFAVAMGAGAAGALELSPLTILLDEDEPIGSLMLRNDGVRDAAYQITGLGWTQRDGEDVHNEDTDLIVTPPIVALAPGESAIVRVGLLAPEAAARAQEGGYRLLIRDISQLSSSGAPLKVRTQVLLPVFLRPENMIEEIDVAETRDAAGRRCLAMHNRGSAHKKLVMVAARNGPAEETIVQQYVLAGERARICPQVLDEALAGKPLKAGFTSAYSNKVEYHDVSNRVTGASTVAAR